jgi:hypothetical protein
VVRRQFRPGITEFRPGEGGEEDYGSPALGLRAWLEDRGCRRGCSAARPDGVRL